MFSKPYADLYELLNRQKNYKQEIEFIWSWARRPKKIIDIGCGTANYWKYYPKGTELKGIDKSEYMIDVSEHKTNIMHGDISEIKSITGKYELATALFDVISYIPNNDWWKYLPLNSGNYFIFDMWDEEKINKEGFKDTVRIIGNIKRTIKPISFTGDKVILKVHVIGPGFEVNEIHEMNIYSLDDIFEFCGEEYEIVDVKKTDSWRTWVKLKRK